MPTLMCVYIWNFREWKWANVCWLIERMTAIQITVSLAIDSCENLNFMHFIRIDKENEGERENEKKGVFTFTVQTPKNIIDFADFRSIP